MTQKDIYEYFTLYFPQYAEHTLIMWPHGKNGIRIKQGNNQEFIFTYNGKQDWCFETITNFNKRMMGGK